LLWFRKADVMNSFLVSLLLYFSIDGINMANKNASITRTFYVGKPGSDGRAIYDLFEDHMLQRNKKISPAILELLDAENQRIADLGGANIKPRFDFQSAKEQRLKLKKTEFQLIKLLNCRLSNGQHCYEILCNFAGTNRALTIEPEKALAKIAAHKCSGQEPFTSSDVENFVEYLEVVLQRRKIEKELRDYRRQKFKSNE
jgi:hypothetical protein